MHQIHREPQVDIPDFSWAPISGIPQNSRIMAPESSFYPTGLPAGHFPNQGGDAGNLALQADPNLFL